jgi:nicotinamide riboside kinase
LDLAWDDADFEAVALRQCADENAAARTGGPVLICDTDALATTIWQERYTGHQTGAVRHIAATMPPRALYILTCEAGVAFQDDGLRDGEHLRAWMNIRFREALGACQVPWIEARGDRHERAAQALTRIDAMLAAGWGLADPLG